MFTPQTRKRQTAPVASGVCFIFLSSERSSGATSETHQSLLVLQRPLVGPVPRHGSAPCVRLHPATWWRLCSFGKWQDADKRRLSVREQRLKHRTEFVGVRKRNSNKRVGPGFGRFLHFIASSPEQDPHRRGGTLWFEVALPSGLEPCVSRLKGNYYSHCCCLLLLTNFFLWPVQHFIGFLPPPPLRMINSL